MTPKLEAALRLISKGSVVPGLGLLLEVRRDEPSSLDPVALALIEVMVKPVMDSVEKEVGSVMTPPPAPRHEGIADVIDLAAYRLRRKQKEAA